MGDVGYPLRLALEGACRDRSPHQATVARLAGLLDAVHNGAKVRWLFDGDVEG